MANKMTTKQKANQERFKKVVAEAKKLRAKNPKLTQAQAVKQAWAIMYKKAGKSVKVNGVLEKLKSKAVKAKKNIAYKIIDKTKVSANAAEKTALNKAKKIIQNTYLGAATKVKAKKPKSTSEMHTDTKSHNVNIKVVSGINQNINTLNDIKYLMQRVEQYEKSIKNLMSIPPKQRNKFDVVAISRYKHNLKSTKQALRELKKGIKI